MVKEIKRDDQHQYQCEECGYVYEEKQWAKKCEAWCREHNSCSLEITQHGQLPPAG